METFNGPDGLQVITDYKMPGTATVGLEGDHIAFDGIDLNPEQARWLVEQLSAWLALG